MGGSFLESSPFILILGICFVAGGFLIQLLIIPALQCWFYWKFEKRFERDLFSRKDKDSLVQCSGFLVIVGSIIIIIHMIATLFHTLKS